MSEWKDKSDFEINKEVVKVRELEISVVQCASLKVKHSSVLLCDWREFNPCNNPSDAWPIIVENNISIELRDKDTALAYIKGDAPYDDKNPLRAAMIAYLEINGVKP